MQAEKWRGCCIARAIPVSALHCWYITYQQQQQDLQIPGVLGVSCSLCCLRTGCKGGWTELSASARNPQGRSTSKVYEHDRFSETETNIRQLQPHFGTIPARCCMTILLLNCACFKDAGFDRVRGFASAFCCTAFNAAVKH